MIKHFHNRGAALLTVLVALMVISIMLFEFQYAAMVERKLAYNELNQIQAYYLAKSGVRLGLLRITLFTRATRDKAVQDIIKQLPGGAAIIDAIWNMPLPAFPPDSSRLAELNKSDKDAAEQALKETRVSDGKSTHIISDESMKINLNDLVVPEQLRNDRIDFRSENPQGTFWYTGKLLINLLDTFMRESENPSEEYGDLRPEELVLDLMDWVTPGDNRFSGGNKDAFYEKLNPPYKAKRNRFYTVNELKMVKGIDEHLFNKLRPFVTVYSDQGKVNINTNSREDFYRALLPRLKTDDVKKILEERDKRGGWSTEDDFAQYVKSTFGASDFEKLFPKKEDYPFTVASQSFLIEAMGKLDRSRSSIQKIIRVAVLLRSSGANCDGITDASKCSTKPGCFWQSRGNGIDKCSAKPRTKDECDTIAGQWSVDGVKSTCSYNKLDAGVIPVVFDPAVDIPKEKALPNAIKILHWSET